MNCAECGEPCAPLSPEGEERVARLRASGKVFRPFHEPCAKKYVERMALRVRPGEVVGVAELERRHARGASFTDPPGVEIEAATATASAADASPTTIEMRLAPAAAN